MVLGSDVSVAVFVGRIGCTLVGGGRAECGMVPNASFWPAALVMPPPLPVEPRGFWRSMVVANMEFAIDRKAACKTWSLVSVPFFLRWLVCSPPVEVPQGTNPECHDPPNLPGHCLNPWWIQELHQIPPQKTCPLDFSCVSLHRAFCGRQEQADYCQFCCRRMARHHPLSGRNHLLPEVWNDFCKVTETCYVWEM